MKKLLMFVFLLTSLSVTYNSYAFAVNNGTNKPLIVQGDKGHYYQAPVFAYTCGYGWPLKSSINLTVCYTDLSICDAFSCSCLHGTRTINVPAQAMLCVTDDGSNKPALSTSGCNPCLENVKK